MPPSPESTLIRIGLPKGRMQDGVLAILSEAGIHVHFDSRGYRPRLTLPGYDAKMLKPQNIVDITTGLTSTISNYILRQKQYAPYFLALLFLVLLLVSIRISRKLGRPPQVNTQSPTQAPVSGRANYP